MDFEAFVNLIAENNVRAFIGYLIDDEDNYHFYSSMPGYKLNLPEGYVFDYKTNTINGVLIENVYDAFEIDAELLASKINEINGYLEIYGDSDSNTIYCDTALLYLKLPFGFQNKNGRVIVHDDKKYKYVNTRRYKVTDSYPAYGKKKKKKDYKKQKTQ